MPKLNKVSKTDKVQIAVIGSGMAGIATSYYLCRKFGANSVALIDYRPPMSYTSAQSGDNYRNWWPHPTMTEFTDHSIDLMEEIVREGSNSIAMNRRGYALATRDDNIDALVTDLERGYNDDRLIRVQEGSRSNNYLNSIHGSVSEQNVGVDILREKSLIKQVFPTFSDEIESVIHVRRAGDINGQQLGQFMLEHLSHLKVQRLNARVFEIENQNDYCLHLRDSDGDFQLSAEVVINAAGPYASHVAKMLGTDLPITNTFQQKIAFIDKLQAIPRDTPYCVDLDSKLLNWSDEERDWLSSEQKLSWLCDEIIGGVHCRPDGGEYSQWVKLGWAYNHEKSDPVEQLSDEPYLDDNFSEVVIRAAAMLQPSLQPYVEHLPTQQHHYGGYYSMTEENWPIIGPLESANSFVVGALSGFGVMAACAAGELCAKHALGRPLPEYASQLSLERYEYPQFLTELREIACKSVL